MVDTVIGCWWQLLVVVVGQVISGVGVGSLNSAGHGGCGGGWLVVGG